MKKSDRPSLSPHLTPAPRQLCSTLLHFTVLCRSSACLAAASLLLAVLAASPARAQGQFGVGLQLGNLSGVTAQARMGDAQALDFSFGGSGSGLLLAGHWRWDGWNVTPVGLANKLGLFLTARGGLGLGLCGALGCPGDASSSTRVLFLADVGAEVRLRTVPIRFFLELGPAIQLVPVGSSGLWLGLGFRYYLA